MCIYHETVLLISIDDEVHEVFMLIKVVIKGLGVIYGWGGVCLLIERRRHCVQIQPGQTE